MPMFLQTVSMVRNNSYVVHSEGMEGSELLSQKNFSLEMIGTLMENALYWDAVAKVEKSARKINARTKKRLMKSADDRSKKIVGVKRRRRYIPVSFFPNRLVHVDGYKHEMANAKKRGICVVCAIESMKQRDALNDAGSDNDDSDSPGEIKRATATHLYCATCSSVDTTCFLCKKHWNTFHTAS